jgi:hypothetical protein
MTNTTTFTVTKQVSFAKAHRARRNKLPDQSSPPDRTDGRVPRIARLMALALRFQQLIDDCVVENQSEIARLSHVSRARVTQIMNLLHLAPDIQDAILNLPPTQSGRDPIREAHVKPISKLVDWHEQRTRWSSLPPNRQIGSM